MKIKGDTIKEGKALSAGRLYRATTSRTIIFEEKDTNDIVNIHFHLRNGQYGIYGNEYKPPFVDDNGGKKADILALVIDENMEQFRSWIFDLKKRVGGEDVIYHLVAQLAETLRHKKSITTYLEGYDEEEHVGYITHELQRERIQEAISKKADYLESEKAKIENMPILVGRAADLKLLKEEAKLKVLTAFSNDYMEVGKKTYQLECYISAERNNRYVCDLDVACS